MRTCKQILLSVLLLAGSVSAFALEWSGTSRLAHQRWAEGDGDDAENRQRESIRFRLMGSQKIGDNFSANIRFNYFTHEFRDRSPKPGHFDRVYLTWNYSDNGMIFAGILGKMYKYVGDHLRSNAGYLPGFTWLHNWRMGDWNVFTGVSRFRMEDPDNDTADPMYYLPQIGVEGKMGMMSFMLGTTYHIYSSVDMTDKAVNTSFLYAKAKEDIHRDLSGFEYFGQVMGSMHGIDWKAYFSMFSNGEAPDDSDGAGASLYGVELMFGDYMLGYAMQNTGVHSFNRAIGEDDWCGRSTSIDSTFVKKKVKDYSALFACSSSKITLGYKWSDNLMPKLEVVSAERDETEMAKYALDKNFSMTRLSLNIKF